MKRSLIAALAALALLWAALTLHVRERRRDCAAQRPAAGRPLRGRDTHHRHIRFYYGEPRPDDPLPGRAHRRSRRLTCSGDKLAPHLPQRPLHARPLGHRHAGPRAIGTSAPPVVTSPSRPAGSATDRLTDLSSAVAARAGPAPPPLVAATRAVDTVPCQRGPIGGRARPRGDPMTRNLIATIASPSRCSPAPRCVGTTGANAVARVLPKVGHYEGRDSHHRHIRFYFNSHRHVIALPGRAHLVPARPRAGRQVAPHLPQQPLHPRPLDQRHRVHGHWNISTSRRRRRLLRPLAHH